MKNIKLITFFTIFAVLVLVAGIIQSHSSDVNYKVVHHDKQNHYYMLIQTDAEGKIPNDYYAHQDKLITLSDSQYTLKVNQIVQVEVK